MEKPIFTLFQIIRENTKSNPIILYDEPKRYYKMLRTIIGVKTGVFKGSDEIRRLYKEKSEWIALLEENDFKTFDIQLMEERLRRVYNDKYGEVYLLDCYEESTPYTIFILFIGFTYILFLINLLNHIRVFSVDSLKYVFSGLQNYSASTCWSEPIQSTIEYKVFEKTR